MKKILLTLTVALISLVNARAFDWVPVENHQLFADMMAYTSAAADSLKGTAAEPLLRKFIERQETVFESDPYAWIGATYKLVYSLEKIYPPHISDGSEAALVRMFMFRILDFPIHNWYDGPKSTEEERRAWEVGRKLNLDQGCNRVLSALSKPAPAPGPDPDPVVPPVKPVKRSYIHANQLYKAQTIHNLTELNDYVDSIKRKLIDALGDNDEIVVS